MNNIFAIEHKLSKEQLAILEEYDNEAHGLGPKKTNFEPSVTDIEGVHTPSMKSPAPRDDFAEYNSQPVFVDYEELGMVGIDEQSNPLTILESLEAQGDWNFTPLEVSMAQAVPVTF